ncbi:hypothetical protein [Streptomyces subrutilus]|uniref:Uncharacterized protein n=1 Tax=Streptomyces subrutilus TaxID=36818 RepID=A0A1E5NXU5_9ACTN|nr:hypothetical protein [Streptomyces subrutilus]OEJ21043.1 hypothetical protein BGK67_34670 [Streptomyces subrutilus]
MPHATQTLTLPGSTDRFIVTARPDGAAAQGHQPLPEGMTTAHIVPALAGDVQPGDVVLGEFEAGPGIRTTVYLCTPYIADPHQLHQCPCDDCEECEEYAGLAYPEGYVCLRLSDTYESCVILSRAAPLAVVRHAVAAQFPPPADPEVDRFVIDGPGPLHGPYEGLRAPRTWGPWDKVSISQEVAEQLAQDLNADGAGSGLTAEWKADWLVISWTAYYQGMLSADRRYGAAGREVVEPDADGRYRIGRLWRWALHEEPSA